MMHKFHVAIHSLPPDARPGPQVELCGLTLNSLEMTGNQRISGLAVRFEHAADVLTRLPRLFFEPDGSFVWRGDYARKPWQVDGELYDGGPRLAYAELRGRCPAEVLDLLLPAFGWPETDLMFLLMREAIYLAEPEFRQLAARMAEA